MEKKENPRYCIKFDIPKREDGITSSQFFNGIKEVLTGFEDFNKELE